MKRERLSPVDFYERDVKPRLSFSSIYNQIEFRQKGGLWWRGPCPLHKGDNPKNFAVNTQTLQWTCFSHCGSGDVIKFLNNGSPARGEEYVKYVKTLAQLVGIDTRPIERELSLEEWAQHHREERQLEIKEAFLAITQAELASQQGEKARAYLIEERGFSPAQIEEFEFGFYPNPELIKEKLLKAGYPEEEIEEAHLCQDARWSGRLVGTWRDPYRRLATFWSRDLSGTSAPPEKYLYLKGTQKASLVAFGLDRALHSSNVRHEVVLVEGLFDVLSLRAKGFHQVVGIGGSGVEMKKERWEKLAGLGVHSATLLLDQDDAGRAGTLQAVSNAYKANKVPVISIINPDELNDAKDPDEFIQKYGTNAFQELLQKRMPASLYQAETILTRVFPDIEIEKRRESVEKILSLVADLHGSQAALDYEDILRLTSERTGYSLEAIKELSTERLSNLKRGELERKLDGVLREAQSARKNNANILQITKELVSKLQPLQAQSIDHPLPFSVDRLAQESKHTPKGRKSGWTALDDLGVRFCAGELTILGARTGHGKTSALIGLLYNWLTGQEENLTNNLFLFYSAEEAETRIYHRLLSLLTLTSQPPIRGWTATQIRDFLQGSYSRGETYRWPDTDLVTQAQERLRLLEPRLMVVYRPSWTVDEIEAHARMISEQKSVGAILVDYLQRIPPPANSFERRDIEVSTIARRLKSLAVNLNVPVITGAQINRDAMKETKALPDKAFDDDAVKKALRARRPKLHHLREGGSEQEADLVLGLMNYRADFETDAEEEKRGKSPLPEITPIDIGILKNRYGDVGKWVSLSFVGRFHLIQNANNDD